jgi:hypothetical protein
VTRQRSFSIRSMETMCLPTATVVDPGFICLL